MARQTAPVTAQSPCGTSAPVWGQSARFTGQRVGREHAVQDGDIVELLR